MKSIEVIWFEKVMPIDEPIFNVGIRISMLQLIMIVLSGFITYTIYNITASPLSLLALLIGFILSFIKIHTLSFFSYLSLAFAYSARKKTYKA